MSAINGFGFCFASPDSWDPESLLAAGGSYRRGHHAHHRFAVTEPDPTAAPDTSRWHKVLVNWLVKLHVVPVVYLGDIYLSYLIYDAK
ncbi:MAG: hypothetical protein GY748_01920 [Planctomycetaceae bacterium]|nr:hypothetical protein [Planctomycetaceae bacterium]